MARLRIPPWLRRGLEAGLLTAVVAGGTLVGLELGAVVPDRAAFPHGLGGSLLLALPVLAIGVLAVAYPVALAATRGDAISGALVAVLIAADVVTVSAGNHVNLAMANRDVALGALAALVSLPPAAVGLVVGQLTPLGFGRSAGLRTTVAATLVALLVLAGAARLG